MSSAPLRTSFERERYAQLVGHMAGSEVLQVPNLRHILEARPSPFVDTNYHGGGFVSDADAVTIQSARFASRGSGTGLNNRRLDELTRMSNATGSYVPLSSSAMRSGPRDTIYFSPPSVHIAIVTCGDLCPGLNDVIRGIVLKALDYGVPEQNILGIRYGFKGFYDKKHKPIILTRATVDDIQLEGGTLLGTSKGKTNVPEIVKRLDLWAIDQLYIIGGPGSHAVAVAIQAECETCRVPCCVVAVPKSIENDILLVDRTFGFETAVEEAQAALMTGKVEAGSGYRGIGLVKMMGRSGFIAVQASLASGVVDVVLIPEVPFRVEAVVAYLEELLDRTGHAVICVTEGAGGDLMGGEQGDSPRSDGAAAAPRPDIGPWLKARLKEGLKPPVDIKYIDSSYLIRSVPTRSGDRVFCRLLASGAVHAAFAGLTGVTVGLLNTHFVYLPIPLVIQAPRKVDAHGEQWNRLCSSIGQPNFDQAPSQVTAAATDARGN